MLPHDFERASFFLLVVIKINPTSWTEHLIFKEEIDFNRILTQYYVYLETPAAEWTVLPSCR